MLLTVFDALVGMGYLVLAAGVQLAFYGVVLWAVFKGMRGFFRSLRR